MSFKHALLCFFTITNDQKIGVNIKKWLLSISKNIWKNLKNLLLETTRKTFSIDGWIEPQSSFLRNTVA
jgi:hypothetical protein